MEDWLPRAPRALLLALASTLALAGCPEPDDPLRHGLEVGPPIALPNGVAFVDHAAPALFVLDPSDRALRPRRFAVGADPVAAEAWRGGSGVLVLSRGRKAAPEVTEQRARLELLRTDGSPPVRVELGARFDRLSQSEDGRFVVLTFGSARAAELGVFSPNQIGIIDLRETTPVARTRTLRSFGSVPTSIVFSPRLGDPAAPNSRVLPDGARTLGVVLSESYVTLVDLDHPDRSEISVPLTLPDDPRRLRPAQILFDARDPTIYVRTSNGNDLFALRLVEVPAAERLGPTGHDFRPSLSQLAAGAGPADVALVPTAEGPRLLVAAADSHAALVVDPSSGRSTSLPLGFAPGRIVLFEGRSPAEAREAPRAAVLGRGAQIAFLELARIEEQGSRNVDLRTLGQPADPTRALVVGRQLVLFPADGQRGLEVVDLERRTASPLVAPPLAEPAVIGRRLFYRLGEEPRVGFLELDTLQPGEVEVDAPVAGLVVVPSGGDGKPYAVALHRSRIGALTVVDAADPIRDSARSADALFLHDVLDRRPEKETR